jgi:hypothetical protein
MERVTSSDSSYMKDDEKQQESPHFHGKPKNKKGKID